MEAATRIRLAAPLLVLLLGACVVDPADPDGESGGDFSFPVSCQEIIEACHEVDPGSGPIHECHESAHDVATIEACDPIRDECMDLCHAAAETDATEDAGEEAIEDRDAEAVADEPIDFDGTTHSHDHAGE